MGCCVERTGWLWLKGLVMLTATAEIGKPLPPPLQAAVASVSEVYSLPEVTAKIVQVVEDPQATAHDMHGIVRTDPALAARILKVVNSAFYGLSAQIGSLDRAILLLGLSAVKNIALAASLSRMFKAEALSEQFAARDLWRHSVASGVCARLLAAKLPSPPDEVFVAGLVHDIGLIVSQQLFHAELKQVLEVCLNQPQSFCTTEEAVIGADHQALGAALARLWRFPTPLRCAIAYHHDPSLAAPEFRQMATIVYVADMLCGQARFGFWLTTRTQEITDEQLRVVGLSREDLDEVTATLEEHVEEAERVFAE